MPPSVSESYDIPCSSFNTSPAASYLGGINCICLVLPIFPSVPQPVIVVNKIQLFRQLSPPIAPTPGTAYRQL